MRVFLGRDPNTGKRRYHNHTVKGTKKDAQRYVNGVFRDLDMGSFVEPTKMTLNSYLDHLLETAARPGVRQRTYDGYEGLLERHVRPSLHLSLASNVGARPWPCLVAGPLSRHRLKQLIPRV